MASSMLMPASVAWRTLGAPRRGAARLNLAPRVPGYRVVREIGTGRRSSVWLAVDTQHGRELVLKIQAADGSMLHREWEVAARLEGGHVLRVHDHGHAGAWAYLVAEYVPGGDLGNRMRAAVPAGEAVSFIRQAAQGLGQLHRAGYVHRDVKPANFLLRADRTLVLADFGLAVRRGELPAQHARGTVTGTPRYVAPEQLRGAPADPAADVYSLGVLLHEMLCGRPPFSGETLMEVLSQHLIAVPPRLPAAVSALQPLVDQMLAKDVQKRLPDMEAVLGLLARGGSRDPE
jgi:serine/threonine protein kinase